MHLVHKRKLLSEEGRKLTDCEAHMRCAGLKHDFLGEEPVGERGSAATKKSSSNVAEQFIDGIRLPPSLRS